MRSISILLATLFLFQACGFDKLKDDIIVDFYITNETTSPVRFEMQYYANASSKLPSTIVFNINNGDKVALFNGLQWQSDTVTNDEIFSFSIIRDVRDDSYAKVFDQNGDLIAHWVPNNNNLNSFYIQSNWQLEETVSGDKIYKVWSYRLTPNVIGLSEQ